MTRRETLEEMDKCMKIARDDSKSMYDNLEAIAIGIRFLVQRS